MGRCFVNKQKVKKDYSVGYTGTPLNELNELISKVENKFPSEYNIKSHENNIIGMYLPDHAIRPPYKSNNTITVYHMYYDIDIFNQFLKDYKVPEHDYDYRFWFGLKYDLDSVVRYLKIVIGDDDKTSNYQKYPSSFIPRPSQLMYVRVHTLQKYIPLTAQKQMNMMYSFQLLHKS